MQQKISLKLLPAQAADEAAIITEVAKTTGKQINAVTGFQTHKKSIDARGKTIWVNITLTAFIDEPFCIKKNQSFSFKDVHSSQKKVVIIGAGPAGLFAALQLIEMGIKPLLLERGKDVRARRRDLAILNKEEIGRAHV